MTQQGWLEPLAPDHAHEMFALVHHSRRHLHAWLPWLQRVHSPQDAEAFIRQVIAERGQQMVIKVDGRICGGLGFYWARSQSPSSSLGYWLGEDYLGQGIATDAVKSACHFGFNHLDLEKIEIHCVEHNVQSRKIPERLGFLLEGIVEKGEWLGDRYVDNARYAILKEEFNLRFAGELPEIIVQETIT